jgi:hypothetical protein
LTNSEHLAQSDSVQKRKRIVSILLLLVFSVLTLKHLLPYSEDAASEDCNQMGHIHNFKMHRMNANTLGNQTQQNDKDHGNEDCHSGKSVFAYSLFPKVIYEIVAPTYLVVFDIVSAIESTIQGPFIEPLRQPPKIS